MHLLLANPSSGSGRGAIIKSQVIAELSKRNFEFRDISGTSYESAASSLSHAIETEPDIESLIVVGGDGMVHLAIQELTNTHIPLLLVPAGTGNDLARGLGLDVRDPLSSLKFITELEPISIDLGFANGRYFANILSTGFDSVVNERANQIRLIKGKSKYNLAILFELPIFKPRNYLLKIDGSHLETPAMLIAVANGKSYGGGMKVCPDADLADGLFDIMVLQPVSKLEFLKVFPKVYAGTHISHPKVNIFRGKKVEIVANAVAYSDGERLGSLPINAEITPQALRIWGMK